MEYGLPSMDFSRLRWLPIYQEHVHRISSRSTRPVQIYSENLDSTVSSAAC